MKLVDLKILKESVLETLYPTRCALCDKENNLLCQSCIPKLKIIDQLKICKTCGEPFGKFQCCSCTSINTEKENITRNDTNPIKQIRNFCLLDENSGRIITLFKDSGEIRLSKIIAYFMYRSIPNAWIKKNDTYLSYIPSTKDAVSRRGFDHCELLAKNLSKYTQIKMINLFRNPENKDQRDLNRFERKQNINDRFKLTNNIKTKSLLNNSNIILIDDVYTTGSTLKSAALSISDNVSSTIYCVTFARAF